MGFTAAGLTLRELYATMADEVEAAVTPAGEVPLASLPPLWEPYPDPPDAVHPQRMAIQSLADVLGYGGAAGGGKTDLIIGTAATQHRSSIIFRRRFTDFTGPEGIFNRVRQVVGVRGHESGRMWSRIDNLRAIEFGAVEEEKDKEKYKGRPHDLKAFDELPDFTETQFRFLCGWLRTTIPGQRCRVIATFNPPTSAEGDWVLRYFGPWLDPSHQNPAAPGELRWFAMVDGKEVECVTGAAFEHRGELIKPLSRTFIPARVEDNPKYLATGYIDQLNALPEPLRSQLRYGSFTARPQDDPWQVVPTDWVLAAQARWTPIPPSPVVTAHGVDPSRGGKDEFVTVPRHGHWFGPLRVHAASDAPDGLAGANLVFADVGGDTTVPVQVDVIGTAGGSVYDQARVLQLKAYAMNGSAASGARDRSGKLGMVNKRAEWHWQFREMLDPTSGQAIALPPDAQMRADLCAARWKPTPRGIQIELKEDIKKRIGRSPDRGEAVIYASAQEFLMGEVELVTGAEVVDVTDPVYVDAYARALAAYGSVS